MNRLEPARSPLTGLRVIAVMAVLTAVAIGIWRMSRPVPSRLLDQGLALQKTAPAAGEQMIRQALQSRQGRYPDAQLALLWLRARRDDWEDSAAELAALDISDARADLLLALARTSLKAGRQDVALPALNELRRRGGPDAVPALQGLVGLNQELGRQDDAIEALQDLIRLRPHDSEPRWDLAQMLRGTHQDQECVAAIHEALSADLQESRRDDLRFLLIDELIALGRREEAWKEVRQIEQSGVASTRLEAQKVDLYRLDGRLDLALETITRIFPQVQQLPVGSVARGAVYLDLGRYTEASRDFERVVSMDPYNEGAHFKLSEAYRGLGRISEAALHRELGSSIRQKRIRINALLKQHATRPDPAIVPELVRLYRELGEDESADRWNRRAGTARPEAGDRS